MILTTGAAAGRCWPGTGTSWRSRPRPEARIQDISAAAGITERTVQGRLPHRAMLVYLQDGHSLALPRTGATITPAGRDPGCASRTPAATVPGRRQPVLAAFDFAYYGNAISSPMNIKLISPHASLVGATTVTLAVFAVAALPG